MYLQITWHVCLVWIADPLSAFDLGVFALQQNLLSKSFHILRPKLGSSCSSQGNLPHTRHRPLAV